MIISKRQVKRIAISIDTRLLTACDKYLEKLAENEITNIQSKSQLIEQALLMYFDTLHKMQLTEGENDNAN